MRFWILDFCRITENNGSLRSQKITVAGLTTAYDQTYTYEDLNRTKSAEAKVGAAERRQKLDTVLNIKLKTPDLA